MKDEVEDFLRRVAQMRAQAEAQARAQQQRLVQPQPQAPQQPQPRMVPPARLPPQPQQQFPQQQSAQHKLAPHQLPHQQFAPQQHAQSPFAPQRQEIVYLEPVEVVDAEVAELGDGVSRHFSEQLRGPQEIAEKVRHLGAEVDLADDKLEAHLHQTFDHKLGQLKQSSVSVAATPQKASGPDVTVEQILHMLRSPESIRDAIVLSEIFRRPEGMW